MMKITTIFLILVSFSLNSFATEESLKSFILTGYDEDNKKKWEMKGDNANISNQDVFLTTVQAKVYEDNQVIDIEADKGYINKSSRNVSLKENVVLKDSKGAVLYTEMLNWDQEKDIVWTDVFLKLVKDENEIVGTGAKIDTQFRKAVIQKDVQLKLIPQTIITSSGPLEVDYIENVAVFKEDVHIVDRRGELFCDTLIVYFDAEEKSIIKAHAKGNVSLRRGQSWTYSKEAIYDVKEGKVSLLGRPKLEIYPQ
ncbi:MAG: LPS export ABC transporter periplasmic protein LptC [Candidatus Saelkia tenebricola]|nr:LPS export ABC transporter periplasmic protein LptC [Candidatus Saelkia tenebricola]